MKIFEKSIEVLRRLQDPLSPTVSDLTGMGSESGSTRQTSADEVIYPEPIGPQLPSKMVGQMISQEFQSFITNAVNAVVQNLNLPAGPPDPPGPPGNPGLPGNDAVDNGNGNSSQLKSDDVGFFDPAMEGEGPIVTVGRYTFYKDVYAFVDRLKDIAAIKRNDKVREALPTCFRDETFIWYSTGFTELEKTLLRTAL